MRASELSLKVDDSKLSPSRKYRRCTKSLKENSHLYHRCGPLKLSQIFQRCLNDANEPAQGHTHTRGIFSPPVLDQTELFMGIRKPHVKSEVVSPLSSPGFVHRPAQMLNGPPNNLVTGSEQPAEILTLAPPNSNSNDKIGRPHILLVDDNPINLQLLIMFMRKHNLSYVSARNGLEALEAFKAAAGASAEHGEKPFDFVLMDVSMPVMDGLESTRWIRKFEEENGLHPTYVIALTGLASQQAQQEALGSGVDKYLPKPVKFGDLKTILEL